MKRSFWITLAASGTLCALALTVQAVHNRDLSNRIAQAETRSAADPDSKTAAGRQENPGKAGELSLDELIAKLREMPPSPNRTALLRIAAERGGARVYDDEDLMKDVSKPQLAGLIALTDPDRAIELLPSPERPVIQGSCLKCHSEATPKRGSCPRSVPLDDVLALDEGWGMATSIFSQDAEAGLRAYLEMGKRDFSKLGRMNPTLPLLAASGSVPLEDDQVPVMAAAINDPEFASIRSDIINLAMNDALYDRGVAAMAERAESLQLSEADLNRYMGSVIGDGSGRGGRGRTGIDVFFSEPEATLQWVSEVRTPEAQRTMIPKMIVNWAKRDANAAVNWLIEQKPSPVRDQTITTLVTRGPNLAPESAAAWALEIRDERMRSNALQNVVNAWNEQDPQAAQEWLRSNQLAD